MSLGAAFHNASSGLTVALRSVGATSSNLANALTENYGKRAITLASRVDGGVRVTGVARLVDQKTLGQLWLASAQSAGHELTLKGLGNIDRLVGSLDDPGSLYSLTTRFESSLVSLASRPDLETRRDAVVTSAQDLAAKFRFIANGIQNARTEAERAILKSVSSLNSLLVNIEKLNGTIAKSHGKNTAALEDERQALINKVSDIVPVKMVAREFGRIALMTPKGQFLLDQSAAEFSFDARGLVTSEHSIDDGTLNLVKLSDGQFHLPASGRLASLFNLRDDVLPDYHRTVSQLAETLINRLSDASANGPIFSYENGNEDPTSLVDMNNISNIDPEAALLALNNSPQSFASHLADASTDLSSRILQAEGKLASAAASREALEELRQSEAVDTDTELQNLIHIEKIYAANAKALQVVGGMLDDLLEIG